MQCAQCQYENLVDATFCQECGTKLQQICPQCQTDNQPTAKFWRRSTAGSLRDSTRLTWKRQKHCWMSCKG